MTNEVTTNTTKIIIAIDGHSSSGKSSMARKLAATIGYRYIDSGAMYRAVTLYAINHGLIDVDGNVDAQALSAALPNIHIDFKPSPTGQRTLLNGKDVENEIRSLKVSSHVSPIAAIPSVRQALTTMQQQFGADKGIVMDGRDIGTSVFPKAEMKIFITASPQVRAERRTKELAEKGQPADYESVLANIIERDHLDETRTESPLRKASDAIFIDNSNLTPTEQDARLLDIYNNIINHAATTY